MTLLSAISYPLPALRIFLRRFLYVLKEANISVKYWVISLPSLQDTARKCDHTPT